MSTCIHQINVQQKSVLAVIEIYRTNLTMNKSRYPFSAFRWKVASPTSLQSTTGHYVAIFTYLRKSVFPVMSISVSLNSDKCYEGFVTFSPIQRHFGLFRIHELYKTLSCSEHFRFTTTTFRNKLLNLTVRLTLTLTLTLNIILTLSLTLIQPSRYRCRK